MDDAESGSSETDSTESTVSDSAEPDMDCKDDYTCRLGFCHTSPIPFSIVCTINWLQYNTPLVDSIILE